jgi:hypothetical protein
LNLIGRIHIDNNNFKAAYDTFSSALSIGALNEYPYFCLLNTIAIAELYLLQNQDDKFEKMLFNAEMTAKQKGENLLLLKSYELWKFYYRSGENPEQLLQSTENYDVLLKQISLEKNKNKLAFIDDWSMHQNEHNENEKLSKEIVMLKRSENNLFILAGTISVFFLLLVALLIRNLLLIKRHKNTGVKIAALQQQVSQKQARLEVLNNEIVKVREKNSREVAQKNSLEKQFLIMQTINEHYEIDLKKLQHCVLQNAEFVRNNFGEFFAYRNTKEELSGNFFWSGFIANKNDDFHDKILLVLVNNTYSGAKSVAQSILCAEILNNIAYEHFMDNLQEIKSRLYFELKKVNMSYKSVVPIERYITFSLALYNTTHKTIKVFDEHNHICIIKDGIYAETEQHELEISFDNSNRLIFYAFSDGFQDLKGSETKRKFGKNRFRAMLTEMHYEKPAKQKKLLAETLSGWQSDAELISDVYVAGIIFSEGE